MRDKYKDLYRTSSISLATAIQTTGKGSLREIQPVALNKFEFIFSTENFTDLQKTVSLFWQKSLPTDALSYFETLRYLKTRLHEEKKNG